MIVATFLCDQCAEAGVRCLADYVHLTDEQTATDPPNEVLNSHLLPRARWQMLCARHHAELTADIRSAYVPADNTLHADR